MKKQRLIHPDDPWAENKIGRTYKQKRRDKYAEVAQPGQSSYFVNSIA